jgi:hypothetical protein
MCVPLGNRRSGAHRVHDIAARWHADFCPWSTLAVPRSDEQGRSVAQTYVVGRGEGQCREYISVPYRLGRDAGARRHQAEMLANGSRRTGLGTPTPDAPSSAEILETPTVLLTSSSVRRVCLRVLLVWLLWLDVSAETSGRHIRASLSISHDVRPNCRSGGCRSYGR